MATIINRSDWAQHPELWQGELNGGAFGSEISIIFNHQDRVGAGPRLHQHPYTETYVVRKGNARFTVDGEVIDASEGQIVVSPANTPHKFVNLGPDALETINIHASPKIVTEWLE
jgi:mannose-6-phosphate isomerase-like protein (cupin superfamily)